VDVNTAARAYLTRHSREAGKAQRFLVTILALAALTVAVSYRQGSRPDGAAFVDLSGLDDALTTSLKARGGMGPVLALQSGGSASASLAEALRDPAVARLIPEDESDASRLAQELKEFRDDLSRAQGERALELHTQSYLAAAALSYYFDDVAQGRRQGDQPSARGNAAGVRALVANHASAAARLGKSPRARAQALFHVNAVAYANSGSASNAWRSLASDAKLDSGLRRRAQMVVALQDAQGGNRDARAKASRQAGSYLQGLSASAATSARLAFARAMARSPALPAYRDQLAAAVRGAKGQSAEAREATISQAIAVWRKAEPSAAWNKPPFSLAHVSGTAAGRALTERVALADWASGRRADAIRKYQALAGAAQGTPDKAALDLRLLDLRRAEFATTHQIRPYELALINAYKTYLDPGVLGDGQDAQVKATAAAIAARHKALIHSELARAQGASNQERKAAIAAADRYLVTVTDEAEIETIKGKVAGLYALAGMHRSAVTLYKELAETTKGDSRNYWLRAVASQSVLATWPVEAPWNGVKNGDASEREELLGLYKKFAEASKAMSWNVAAHVGLLELQAGRQEAAFGLWTASLKADARGPHAANAAGTMLVGYRAAKAWGDLEAMARLAMSARLSPVYRGKTIDTKAQLALALLEGGKDALEAQKFKVAVAKLKEFVQRHADADRHDEGFFLLAHAYRGNGQHPDAIKTLLAFVDRYPTSKYNRSALLNGGDWSMAMAFEENAIHFHNRFVQRYGDDAEAQRVRAGLIELYVGRGIYAEALGVVNLTVRAKGVDAATKAQSIALAMDLEERQGSARRAEAAADLLLKHPGSTDEQRASAYGLKIRMASAAKKFDQVKAFEAKLVSLGSETYAEPLGEARYILALAHGKTAAKGLFNLELKDPSQTLAQRYDWYKGSRSMHMRVCEAGQTSFCAPAMHRLARMSEQFMRSIEDLDIQNDLAKEVVDRFKAQKQQVMNDVTATAQRADARAVAVVGEGYTDPDWTQAVLWQNTADWNFERVTGETGNGYVQWAAPGAAE
jgi:TolA-binding protein